MSHLTTTTHLFLEWYVILLLTIDVFHLYTKSCASKFSHSRDTTKTPKIYSIGHVNATTEVHSEQPCHQLHHFNYTVSKHICLSTALAQEAIHLSICFHSNFRTK